VEIVFQLHDEFVAGGDGYGRIRLRKGLRPDNCQYKKKGPSQDDRLRQDDTSINALFI
jgi:hypothetical protein